MMGRSNRSDVTVCVLTSGSKGNSTYISDGQTSILFDAGLSGKGIQRRMESNGLFPEKLKAIVVSHEHMDHIRGVGVLSRRFKLPIHINTRTLKAAEKYLGALSHIHLFECGRSFEIGLFRIQPFSISHDAKDPSAFTVFHGKNKIGIATDMGVATNMVRNHLKGCHLLIVEANHDSKMLINGPYPWPLKQRIKGRHGHLSNHEFKELLIEIKHEKLNHLILAHLSEENNNPDFAIQEAREGLSGCSTQIHLASQYRATDLITLRGEG